MKEEELQEKANIIADYLEKNEGTILDNVSEEEIVTLGHLLMAAKVVRHDKLCTNFIIKVDDEILIEAGAHGYARTYYIDAKKTFIDCLFYALSDFIAWKNEMGI